MSQIGTETSTLGEAIRAIRNSMAWSQSELAGKAGCSVGAIVDLELRNAGSVEALSQLVAAMRGRWVGLPKGPAIHDRVRVARREAALSLDELANSSKVSKGALIRLERGSARVATLQAVLPFIAPRCTIKGPNVFQAIRSSGHQDVRFTPADVLQRLVRVLGPIGLDPCGDPRSFVRAKTMYSEGDDGLHRPWTCKAGWVFVNPPFSSTATFVQKGLAEWEAGRASRVVFLLRGQTHGRLFHDLLHPLADVLFLRDRIAFYRPDGETPQQEARFGIMLVTLGVTARNVRRLSSAFRSIHLPPSRPHDLARRSLMGAAQTPRPAP